jgi:hypothetical protein
VYAMGKYMLIEYSTSTDLSISNYIMNPKFPEKIDCSCPSRLDLIPTKIALQKVKRYITKLQYYKSNIVKRGALKYERC